MPLRQPQLWYQTLWLPFTPLMQTAVGGREENTLDSLLMLWNDDALSAVNMLFFWSVVGLNVFGLMVTQVLGSVFRAVMLTARTASVSHPKSHSRVGVAR